MGQRRRSREIALQILYCMDLTETPPDTATALIYELAEDTEERELRMSPLTRPFAEHLVQGVALHREELDERLRSASDHWRLERMSAVDRNILRMALFEMLYCPDVPPKVTINEAIDIGKRYGSEDSGAFINGILDRLLSGMDKPLAKGCS
jgi:transcription antitermination protein NusB